MKARLGKPILYISIILGLIAVAALAYVILPKNDGANDLELPDFDRLTGTQTALKSAIPEELQGRLLLFILAGQSNISGRGDVPRSGQASDPRVFLFGNDYHWKIASEPVDDPTNQVDKVSEDIGAGFGPALAFATSLLDRSGDLEMAIGLIPCARGATTIGEWQRNLDDNSLYGSCLKRARTASPMGEVAGILFYQGESDALDPNQYPQLTLHPRDWGTQFSNLVRDFRSDLSLPDLPVVFAQIGTNDVPEKFPNWETVKEQQRSVELPFCAMITTDDLALKDNIHFTIKGYRILGERFAEAFWNLAQLHGNR